MKTSLPKGGLKRQSAGTGIRYFSAVDNVMSENIKIIQKSYKRCRQVLKEQACIKYLVRADYQSANYQLLDLNGLVITIIKFNIFIDSD